MKSNKTLYLYVVTHCESCYNKRKIFTGRLDSTLTEAGHLHAQMLARQLSNKLIDVAYTSSLRRTKQTLKHIIKFHPRAKVVIDDRIIERDYGHLSGKSKIKFRRDQPDLFQVYHRSYDVPPPGGESIQIVEQRVLPFIKEVIASMQKNSQNVLIVAHSNSIRPIRRFFEKLSIDQMMHLENSRHKVLIYKVIGGE